MSVLLFLLLPPISSTSSPSSNFTDKRGGLISSCVHPLLLWWLMLFLWLLYFPSGEVTVQETAWRLCLLCSLVQRCPEGLRIRRGDRDIDGTTELGCSLLGGSLSQAMRCMRCVAVNWGNNYLLNKTYVYVFSPRKQRIFWIMLFSEYLLTLAPLVMGKL